MEVRPSTICSRRSAGSTLSACSSLRKYWFRIASATGSSICALLIQQPVNRIPEPLPLDGESVQRPTALRRQSVITARRPLSRLPPAGLDEPVLPQTCQQRIDRPLAGPQPVGLRQPSRQLKPVALPITQQRQHAVLDR